MCFVCQEPLKNVFVGSYDHYDCRDHMKVMYDKISGEFRLLRIKDSSLPFRLDHSVKSKRLFIKNNNSRAEMYITNFDITQYSYSELENKIKTYILFS